MRKKELFFGLILLTFSLSLGYLYYLDIESILLVNQTGKLSYSMQYPMLFNLSPLIFGILGLISIVLIIKGFKKRKNHY